MDLQAGFPHVRAVAPILPQLGSLCIFDSFNMQVPYLFSCVLGTTLDKLRSLEVQQVPNPNISDEGTHWQSTTSRRRKAAYSVLDSEYVIHLVELCPNLEELGFLGQLLWESLILVRLLQPWFYI